MTNTAVTDPFFVIFDTCTHAGYYGDVHEVLALPAAQSSDTNTNAIF